MSILRSNIPTTDMKPIKIVSLIIPPGPFLISIWSGNWNEVSGFFQRQWRPTWNIDMLNRISDPRTSPVRDFQICIGSGPVRKLIYSAQIRVGPVFLKCSRSWSGPVLDFYFSGPHPVRSKPVSLHGSLNRIEVRPYEGAENIDACSFKMT